MTRTLKLAGLVALVLALWSVSSAQFLDQASWLKVRVVDAEWRAEQIQRQLVTVLQIVKEHGDSTLINRIKPIAWIEER